MKLNPKKLSLVNLCLLAISFTSSMAFAEPEWVYSVRPGDTLIGISKRYLVDSFKWSQIQKNNAVVNPRKLKPGQAIRIPLALLKQKPAPATLMSFSGNVDIKLASGASHHPEPNEVLHSGDQVETGDNSSATIVFADDSIMTVQPKSIVQLDTMSTYEGGGMVDTKVRLQQGRAEVHANPNKKPLQQMQIVTPSAVAAVRGTQFRVNAESAVTREETTEGVVALDASGSEVELAKGYGSVAEQGKPPSPPVALLPAPSTSSLPSVVERLPMRFELAPNVQARAWYGQVSKDKTFQSVILEKKSDKPLLTFSDLPDGDYFLRVRAEDLVGLQGLDALHAFVVNARPFAPMLLAPKSKGVTREERPVLQWSASQGVVKYRVELAKDALFAEKVFSEVVNDQQLKPNNVLSEGDYYWRVASIDAQEQGPFSEPQLFSYKPLPNAPALDSSSLVFDKDSMQLQLPTPSKGLHYEVKLNTWQGVSQDGKVVAPRPASGKAELAVRMVEEDGTAGPYATQLIEVPKQTHWEVLIFLLPALAL